jgi:hypothetical protein
MKEDVQLVKLMQIYGKCERTGCGDPRLGEHALVFSSNLPLGVSIRIDGGRKGYSEGRRIRKW